MDYVTATYIIRVLRESYTTVMSMSCAATRLLRVFTRELRICYESATVRLFPLKSSKYMHINFYCLITSVGEYELCMCINKKNDNYIFKVSLE